MRLLSIFLFITSFLLLNSGVYSQENGAKAIFHSGEGPTVMASSESSKPKVAKSNDTSHKEQYMGVSYWIDLVDQTD